MDSDIGITKLLNTNRSKKTAIKYIVAICQFITVNNILHKCISTDCRNDALQTVTPLSTLLSLGLNHALLSQTCNWSLPYPEVPSVFFVPRFVSIQIFVVKFLYISSSKCADNPVLNWSKSSASGKIQVDFYLLTCSRQDYLEKGKRNTRELLQRRLQSKPDSNHNK